MEDFFVKLQGCKYDSDVILICCNCIGYDPAGSYFDFWIDNNLICSIPRSMILDVYHYENDSKVVDFTSLVPFPEVYLDKLQEI